MACLNLKKTRVFFFALYVFQWPWGRKTRTSPKKKGDGRKTSGLLAPKHDVQIQKRYSYQRLRNGVIGG